MPSLRSSTDENLARLLRARAEADPTFRESLSRVVTADAKYEDYVQRKQQEGGQVLPKEEWEAYVFGKAPSSGGRRRGPFEKKGPGGRAKRTIDRMMRRRRMKEITDLWEAAETKTKKRPKRLFPFSETKDLPQWASQPTGDRDRIMAQAKEGQSLMLDWLDRGEGVDKAIGAKTVRRDKDPDAEVDLNQEGPLVVIAPRKRERAAEEKVRRRYGGNWAEGAVDLVRATIAVDKYEDLTGVVDKLQESGIELVSKPRNRFRQETAAGYRDVVLNARLPNGHVMELQLHLKPILKAKEENHPIYSRIRGIGEEASDEGELTPEMRRMLDEGTRQMRQRFESAWQEAVRMSDAESIFDPPPSESPKPKRRRKRKKTGTSEVRHFKVDGLPVRWKTPKLPRIYHGPDDSVQVDDLAWFAERAVPITQEEFEGLVKRWVKKSATARDVRETHDADPLVEAMRHRAAADASFRDALQSALHGQES